MPVRRPALVAVAAATALGLAACSSSGSANATAVSVSYDDTTCAVAPTSVPAGEVAITATYSGSGTAEVYLYAQENGAFSKVVGEVEDLTAGLTKSFTATVAAGSFEVACKSGGKDVRTALTVT